MRTTVLIAMALLATGCSGATVSGPEPAESTGREASPTAARTTPQTTAQPSTAPPARGTPISAVISWIEAGHPADAAGYHRATRDGEITELGDDIVFTVGSGARATTCLTDARHTGGALACLVDLVNPPPRPTGVYGEWKGNWIDFDGTILQVGSAHGDPGPFHNGDGPALPDGATLSFSDYRCRAERADLFCVNYAHRSAVRLGPAGTETFGCLQPVPTPVDAGELFRCG